MCTHINLLRVCCPRIFNFGEISAATVNELLHTQVARIFIPQTTSRAAKVCTPIRPERRRTPRRHIPIPLFVYGHTPEGHPFYEETFTSAVNVHGGSMRLEASVQLGQRRQTHIPRQGLQGIARQDPAAQAEEAREETRLICAGDSELYRVHVQMPAHSVRGRAVQQVTPFTQERLQAWSRA